MPEPDYSPPWWYRGAHLQTIWGPLFRRLRRPPCRRARWETPDGDFLDLDWLGREPAPAGSAAAPVLLILHGLEGSSRSHYATGLLREAAAADWQAVVLNFRSCSGEPNRGRRLYHAGETSDLDWVIRALIEREPSVRLALVGVSLGANVVLKWLGEHGARVPAQIGAAVAISTPFNLTASADTLDRGLRRRLYTAGFLRSMKAKIRAQAALYHGLVDMRPALRARTFALYDRLVTAPLNGFTDEVDYWTRASSGPYLAKIRRPCLLINALNDPFIPAWTLPRRAVARSPWLEALFVLEGGHAGFLENLRAARSWAERQAMAFVRRQLAPVTTEARGEVVDASATRRA